MLLYLGTQTSTILYFDSRLPESNRGHVNILIDDWIGAFEAEPACGADYTILDKIIQTVD